MPRGTRIFRIFVSSTFSDFGGEREVLRDRVFPRLRALCQAHGATFQAVDLRWGVSRAAAEHHETMRICLGEIDRCRAVTSSPNFIALLGDRYGWRPAPEVIPGDEFREMDRHLQARDRCDDLDLLHRCYRRDDNAVPHAYRLDLGQIAGRETRRETLDRVTALMRLAASALPFSERQRRRYMASATELEIAHRGLLEQERGDGSALCIFRSIDGLPPDARAEAFVDLQADGTPDHDAQERLRALKTSLSDGFGEHVLVYRARWGKRGVSRGHLSRFAADTYARLSRMVEIQLSGGDQTPADPVDLEIAVHASFAQERRRMFVGRADTLRVIDGYLRASANHPFVIHGASGSGKSTVMARATADAPGDRALVYRFIGASPGSAVLPTLLNGLCHQLARIVGDDRTLVETDVPELVAEFRTRLTRAGTERRLVLFLDAVDQISAMHGARALNWLPATLPDGVHIVMSTVNDDVYEALARLVPATHRHELRAMRLEEGSSLLDSWLDDAGRTLQPPQRAAILDAFRANGLPLYLRLAFEEARAWASDAAPGAPASDVPDLIRALFARLSQGANHGTMLVARSVASIAAGRYGVSEDELLDLLSTDPQVMREFREQSPDSPQTDAMPGVVWSRLYFDLAPYLTERGVHGTSTIDFFHRQLREVVERDYLAGRAGARRHRALASYFGGLPDDIASDTAAAPNLRKLAEWPYQLAHAGLWRELEQLLTSFAFLRAKVGGLGPLAAIEDFDIARHAAPATGRGTRFAVRGGHLGAVQDALRLSSGVVSAEPDMLAGQFLGRLRGQHRALATLLRDAERRAEHEARIQAARKPAWLNPLISSLGRPGGPLNQAIVLDSEIAAARFAHDGVVLVGCEDGTLRLIDLRQGSETWRVAAHPSGIVDVAYDASRHRAVTVSADGTVAVWSLDGRIRDLSFRVEGVKLRCVCVAPDGSWVVIGGDRRKSESPYSEGIASIRDLADGHERVLLVEQQGSLTTIAISPDGLSVLSGSSWGVVRQSDVSNGLGLRDVRTHDGSIGSIALATDRDLMLIGSGDQSSGQYNLRLWSVREWRELHVFKGHRWMITCVAVTPDGRIGVSGAYDTTVRAWDLSERRQMACFRGHPSRVRAVAMTPDGRRVVSAGESTLYDWSLDKAIAPRAFDRHEESVSAVSASPDGSRALSCSADGTVAIWNLWTRRATALDGLAGQNVTALAVSRGGRFAVLGTASGALLRVDIRSADVREVQHFDGNQVTAIALTPDARHAAVGDRKGAMWMVDVRTGKEVRRFDSLQDRITGLAFVEDGRRMVSASMGFSLLMFDNVTGRRVHRRNHGSGAPAFAATPDGRRAVSGTQFGRLLVWDLVRMRRIASLPHNEIGQNSTVMAVAITPDGRRALSGGDDRLIRAWDLTTKRCVATFAVEDFTTCASAAGPDLFLAGSRNGAVHLLKLVESAES